MAYWLFKSEPETWSWDDQVKRGKRGQAWDGVRNFQARKNMESMKAGDRGFFYHSGATKEIVGYIRALVQHATEEGQLGAGGRKRKRRARRGDDAESAPEPAPDGT